MNNNYCSKETKTSMKKTFLIISKKFKKYLNYKKEIYWIYSIYDIEHEKYYIGKTVDINKRANDYINAYIKGDKQQNITKNMIKYGIDNFIMYPIELAFNPESASIKEKYYIDLYDSIKNGYNKKLNSNDKGYKK